LVFSRNIVSFNIHSRNDFKSSKSIDLIRQAFTLEQAMDCALDNNSDLQIAIERISQVDTYSNSIAAHYDALIAEAALKKAIGTWQ
jgi:outer membrane protein TolC